MINVVERGPECNLVSAMQRCSNGFQRGRGPGTVEMATLINGPGLAVKTAG